MRLSMLTCKEASRLQSQAMDRRLAFGERLSLRFHMAMCDACTRVSRQLELLRRALRAYPGPDDSAEN